MLTEEQTTGVGLDLGEILVHLWHGHEFYLTGKGLVFFRLDLLGGCHVVGEEVKLAL